MLLVGIRVSDQTQVVAQDDGRPVQPNSLTHEFVQLLANANGLPDIRFRDLQHTHATRLLSNSVHPRSPRSASAIRPSGSTLDLYSHVPPGMQEAAAAKVDAAIRAAIEGS